ncbi:Apoptosis-inducing factor 1, mitochondrial [Gracilariopsis chorda]|uniref:Apoptosis-inducing factor 1, mitochondrial n=1 Tax=Gracilariopsis chorda TaxID=448386 RepID=A0A2V3IQW0_9FLOR|nr:Apoptosis-inducing factor 1, mitochondrial [Gracilariopsis chorda]|eukprot:PXF44496.1 Apoptosis-inducing factor 1, mitochondrial [Gracilariopsis chorda]
MATTQHTRALRALFTAAGAAGAAAAAAAAASRPARADSAAPDAPDQPRLRALLARAAAASAASRAPPAAPPPHSPPPLSAPERSRARSALQRYYALSDAALSDAALPLAAENKSRRVPAHVVFRRLPPHVAAPIAAKFLVVGGGTAAWSAIQALVRADGVQPHQIVLVAEEPYWPYNRTMLSKELWRSDIVDHAPLPDPPSVEYAYKHVAPPAHIAVVNSTAVFLDPDQKYVRTKSGVHIAYDKLLLATGATPRHATSVAPVLRHPSIQPYLSTFRTFSDYRALRQTITSRQQPVVVIGGGFLGTELALALTAVSDNVTLVVSEAGVLFRVLPRYLCHFLAAKLENAGVRVLRSAFVSDASEKDGHVTLQIDSTDQPQPTSITTSHIIAAVGVDPCTQLAKTAGLEIDRHDHGVRVNDFMMVEPDVYAAGDVASFHDRSLGRRRVEHWDHAVVSGRIAAANMAGARERYALQSMFWSDLPAVDVSFTAVGLVDSRLDTVAVWNLEEEAVRDAPSINRFADGVVYYLERSEIVGVVLWNAPKGAAGLRRARALVDAKTCVRGLDERTLAALVNLREGRFRECVRTARDAPL